MKTYISRTGEKVTISKMTDDHLRNTIRFFEKKYKEDCQDAPLIEEFEPLPDFHIYRLENEKWKLFLEGELELLNSLKKESLKRNL
jgi:hypothetical protein